MREENLTTAAGALERCAASQRGLPAAANFIWAVPCAIWLSSCAEVPKVTGSAMEAAQCMAEFLKRQPSAEDVVSRVDFKPGVGEHLVVAYSFHDNAGYLRRDVVPIFLDPSRGLYGYPLSVLSADGPLAPATAELERICPVFGYLILGGI